MLSHPVGAEEMKTVPKVVADCGEDGVGGIAFTAFEIAAPEVTFALHVADHRLDRGTPSQLTFDDAEHATFLALDEDKDFLGPRCQ
jgi:hypothetical protein